METRILNDLALFGALVMETNESGFPPNPKIGTFIIKDRVLYGYLEIGDLETWYPFASKTNSYVHSQGLPSTTWVVNHELNTLNVWYQIKDSNGQILIVGKTDINENNFRLNFTEPVTGTVVVVAPDTLDVPQVKATTISVANDAVLLNSDGVFVNGSRVLTSAFISNDIAAAVAPKANSVDVYTKIQSDARIQALIGAAPSALDTLEEIAAQLADDNNAIASLTTAIISGNQTTLFNANSYTDSFITIEQNSRTTAINASATSTLALAATDASAKVSLALITAAADASTKANNAQSYADNLNAQEQAARVNADTTITTALDLKAPLASPAFTGTVTGVTSAMVGLGNVNNTADTAKPISTAQQTALDLKAPLASPAFTGTVTGVTSAMVGLGNVDNKSSVTIRSELSSVNVTTALGFTPYNATNPSGYTTNTGTLTSVTGTSPIASSGGTTPAISLAANYGDTLNPYAAKTGNFVLAAPTGTTGVPVFRSIVVADIPTLNQNTTGTAATLTTGRTIALTGDVTYTSNSFNGSANVTGTATLASVGTPGTYTKVTTDAKGRVTSSATLVASDIPDLDASKITSGVIDAARLPSYVDDVIEAINLVSFPVTGETGKIYVALDTNKVYRWSGSAYVHITSGAVDSVAGKTGIVTLTSSDVGLGNVDNKSSVTIRSELSSVNVTTALGFTPYNATNPSGYTTNTGTLTSIIAGTGLSGGTITSSGTVSLANTTVVAGSYTASNITVDAQGRITAASTGTVASSVIGTNTQVAFNNAGTMSGSANLVFNGTNLTCGGTITANSDESLKTNWRSLPDTFVQQLAKVKHGTYDRIDEALTQDGVSAQSLQVLLPNSVIKSETGILSVAYGNAALVSVIKSAEYIVRLEERIAMLEKLVLKATT